MHACPVGVVLTLPLNIQQQVVALCEHWVKQQLTNWPVMIVNTFLCLLQYALETQPQVNFLL